METGFKKVSQLNVYLQRNEYSHIEDILNEGREDWDDIEEVNSACLFLNVGGDVICEEVVKEEDWVTNSSDRV